MESLARADDRAEGRIPRKAAFIIAVSLIVAIAAVDTTLARYYNLGALYMIPFIIATQYVRASMRLLLLAILLVMLNYLGLLMAYVPAFQADDWLRFRLINRGFVAVSIAGAALLVVFYLRVRDYWLRKQSAMAPKDEEVSLLLQVFQMFEDVVAVLVATLMAGATFMIDFYTPRTMNLPILYLMPVAVIAITRSVWLLWISVPILLTLAYIGFYCGPDTHLAEADLHRTAVNRELVAGAIVAAAALFHFLCVPHRRKNYNLEAPRPAS